MAFFSTLIQCYGKLCDFLQAGDRPGLERWFTCWNLCHIYSLKYKAILLYSYSSDVVPSQGEWQ